MTKRVLNNIMRKTLCIIALILQVITANSQTCHLFTSDRELSSTMINKIYQDRNNMIWIATEDGLNRYDGSKFTIYKNNPNVFSDYDFNGIPSVDVIDCLTQLIEDLSNVS